VTPEVRLVSEVPKHLYGAFGVKWFLLGFSVGFCFRSMTSRCSASDRPRGARHQSANIAPQTCIRQALSEPNHDAVLRIGGEAPGRRAHSKSRRARPCAISGCRHLGSSSAVNDKYASELQKPQPSWPAGVPSHRGAKGNAVRHLASGRQSPKHDQELAGERDDHGLARRTASVCRSCPIPRS
jgi:hypothetical protein